MNEAFVALSVWAPHGGGDAWWTLSSKGSLIAQGVVRTAASAIEVGMRRAVGLPIGPWQTMGEPYRRVKSINFFPVSRLVPGANRYDFTAQEASA